MLLIASKQNYTEQAISRSDNHVNQFYAEKKALYNVWPLNENAIQQLTYIRK